MTDDWTNGVSTLYRADAREIPLPDASVHMCVTSPPYWGLRDYGLGQWEGGDAECGHKPRQMVARSSTLGGGKSSTSHQQEGWTSGSCGHCGAVQQTAGIGLEPTLGEWVENIVEVMREVRRVLRDDGTVWLNLGDSYAGSGKGRMADGTHSQSYGDKQGTNAGAVNGVLPKVFEDLPAKNLMGQPWRVAFALQDDGWILRSAIVWHKPNPMPESTKDRPTSAYEMVFLLAKQARYFYDAEAGRERSITGDTRRPYGSNGAWQIDGRPDSQKHGGQQRDTPTLGANARNVWSIPTQGRPDAHFATFPDELPRRCILAGTSERGVCAECGAPWVRQVELGGWQDHPQRQNRTKDAVGNLEFGASHYSEEGKLGKVRDKTFLGWQPTCDHGADTIPATVLDPFVGSGTTCAVAQQLGRRGVGLDLNAEYLGIAAKRIGAVSLPLTGLLL